MGSATALVALYYVLPLTQSSAWPAVTMLVIGLVVFVGLVARRRPAARPADRR